MRCGGDRERCPPGVPGGRAVSRRKRHRWRFEGVGLINSPFRNVRGMNFMDSSWWDTAERQSSRHSDF